MTPPGLAASRWAVWVLPQIAMVWLVAFLVTPEVQSVRRAADLLPILNLAVLIGGAVWAVRFFLKSDLCRHMMESQDVTPRILAQSVFLAAAVLPVVLCVLEKYYWIHVLAISLIYVLLAISLNIVVGLSGLLVLGFSAFYGIGAYVAAILTTGAGSSPHLIWALLPAAAGLAAGFGLLLGAPTLRLRGDYLAIVTMGFGEIVRIILTNWEGLTRGPIGISGVAPFHLAGWSFNRPFSAGPIRLDGDTQYYFLLLLTVAFFVLITHRLSHSRIGRAWVAFREDELAARCYGIDVTRYKLLAFAVAASGAGIAGVYFASLQGFVDPTSFTFLESVLILSMVVLGGMGSLPGCAAAAVILQVLPEKLQMLREYRMLIFGALMIVFMCIRPEGLIPSRRRLRRIREVPVP